jgi:hypothetical protein
MLLKDFKITNWFTQNNKTIETKLQGRRAYVRSWRKNNRRCYTNCKKT